MKNKRKKKRQQRDVIVVIAKNTKKKINLYFSCYLAKGQYFNFLYYSLV